MGRRIDENPSSRSHFFASTVPTAQAPGAGRIGFINPTWRGVAWRGAEYGWRMRRACPPCGKCRQQLDDEGRLFFSMGPLIGYRVSMGCLPVIILFILGAGIGWWLGGDVGAVWGAGAGLALGIVLGLVLVLILRRAHTDTRVDH